MTRAISAESAQIAARMLIEHRERAARHAAQLTAAARQRGIAIDTNIQYAEGSAAAYAIACSILAGVAGTSIDDLAGEWAIPADPLPPMLPEPDATAFAPGDVVAVATVTHDRASAADPDENSRHAVNVGDEIARALGEDAP